MTLFRPGMRAVYHLSGGTVIEIPGAELSGRELDAAVASRVFGYRVEWRTGKLTSVREPLYRLDNGSWVVVPYYSERLSPSIMLAVQLQHLGWQRKSAPRDPHVTLEHTDGRSISATGRSEYEALARAALKGVRA